jgi:putative ABC transport system ATP-binding protein
MTDTLSPPSVDVAARAVDASKIYGSGEAEVRALNAINVQFQTSRLTAIMGPSGSGKSTLLSCAAGLDRATSGRVLIEGDDVTDLDEESRAELRRSRIGFVFQSYHLMPYLTVAQNVALPVRLGGHRPDPGRLAALLERVGLGDRAASLPSELSGGQQQRVAIARALLGQPAVVLADEPTGALDSSAAAAILHLLRACVDDLGATVVMVTHDPVAASIADSVVFLVDGRVAGRLADPTAAAVATQMARLDELVVAG